jgi:hypothetical protein
VAVLKKEMATTQVLLLSMVATNYFLLLGLSRMYDHRRQQTLSDTINPRYALVLLLALLMTVLPAALDDGLSASTKLDHAVAPSSATLPEKAATMARIMAVLSLVIFAAYITLICYMGSDMERIIRTLRRQVSIGRDNTGKSKDELSGVNSSDCIRNSLAMRPQSNSASPLMTSASYTARSDKVPWRSAFIFILSIVFHPVFCIALVDATAPDPGRWSTLVFVKILIITLITGLTGLAAYVAHGLRTKRTFDSAKTPADVVALITRLLLCFRPLCIVIQWAVYGTPPPAVALFPAALLLSAYFLENSIGEMYV